MSDRLLPCPFCGGEASPASHIEYSRYATSCKSCGVRGPSVIIRRDDDPQEIRRMLNGADRLWNTRQPVGPETPMQVLKEAEAVLFKENKQ